MSHTNAYTNDNTYVVSTPRHGNKWTVSECLRLHREFDLLQLSIPDIARLHGRSVNAIMCKIHSEGWATYNDLYVQTYGQYTENNDLFLKTDLQTDDEDDASLDEDSDEEFIPNVLSDSSDDEYEDDGSNYEFIYQRIKSMQQQINTLMGYFTQKTQEQEVSAEL